MGRTEVSQYSYAKECPGSSTWEVRTEGLEQFVHHAPPADFACFSHDGPVTVELTCRSAIQEVAIRPLSRGVSPEVRGNVVRLTLPHPMNVFVDAQGVQPLFLFSDPPETERPDPEDEKVRYFRAGEIHEVGELHLEDGETMYLEGGAVVRGSIRANDLSSVRVRGRGVIDGSYYTKGVNSTRTFIFEGCRSVLVEDITIINPTTWTLVLSRSHNCVVRNVREIGDGGGSDGIDIVGCRDVLVEDCFLRNGDDCVVVKSVGPPDDRRAGTDVYNVLVQRCALLNTGGGNALEIGHELLTQSIRDIIFQDCDIVHVHGHGAAFSIHNSDRATVQNVLFENIRVEHHFTYLVDLRVLRSRWSKDDVRGRIRDIHFKDIQVTLSIYNPGYTISMIGGWDQEHLVENVTFENFRVDGRKVLNADDMDLYCRNATGIVFR